MPTSKQGTATEKVWTEEERAAMQESARERKAQAKLSPSEERAAGEEEIQAKIAEMPEADRAMAARIHALVVGAPRRRSCRRTYYGMPAYATGRQGHLLLPAQVEVQGPLLDLRLPAGREARRWRHVAGRVRGDGADPAVEARIAELVKKAAG